MLDNQHNKIVEYSFSADNAVGSAEVVVESPTVGPVKNLRTGLQYLTISAAICDTNTIAGDTITIGSGTYKENVVVNKTLNITGVDTGSGLPVVSGPGDTGIKVRGADNTILRSLNVTGASMGVAIESDGCNVSGCLAIGNYIGFIVNTSNNNLNGVTACGNTLDGIEFRGTNNHLNDSNASYNGFCGIELFAQYNTVNNSTFSHNQEGIFAYYSYYNSISSNRIANNTEGVNMYSAFDNVLWLNTFSGNDVDVYPWNYAVNKWNSTTPQTYTFQGSTLTNYTGNYWDSYSGPDANADGIGDTAKVLDTKNSDPYPMLLVPAATVGPVKNLRTGQTYMNICAAITDTNTVAGDTITVDSGTYRENVIVNKTLSLTGIDTGSGRPVVDGLNGIAAISVTANNAVVQGFTATDATTGIDLWGVNDTVKGNNASNNVYFGIFIEITSMRNNVTGNVANDNRNGEGIGISGPTGPVYNNVSGNVVCNNGGGFGGIVCGACSNNTISNNVVNDNRLYGIFLSYSSNNTLAGNTVNNNSYAGIYLYTNCNNNTLTGNNVSRNGNDYNSHTAGILLNGNCNDNRLTGNNASNNLFNGIYFQNGGGTGNVVWLNVFRGNYQNAASDYLAGAVNRWNSTAPQQYQYGGQSFTNYTGNFWGDYAGIDANADGIGDTPYDNAMLTDYYPMLFASAPAPGPVKNLKDRPHVFNHPGRHRRPGYARRRHHPGQQRYL